MGVQWCRREDGRWKGRKGNKIPVLSELSHSLGQPSWFIPPNAKLLFSQGETVIKCMLTECGVRIADEGVWQLSGVSHGGFGLLAVPLSKLF